MTNATPPSDPPSKPSAAPNSPTNPPTPQDFSIWRSFSGALISGGFAFALYSLTSAIAQAFANKPLHTANFTAQNISVAVRTLVVGMSTLATGIFAITALGLLGLTLQVMIQRMTAPKSNP